jgi:hypothetical protein
MGWLPQEPDEAADYFREVLLSYRLIFGQDKASYEDFTQLTNKFGPISGQPTDPILLILCGRCWDSDSAIEIYDEIKADDASHRYSVSDFPFLGRRLLALQKNIRYRRPNTIQAWWYPTVWIPVIWLLIQVDLPPLCFFFITKSQTVDSTDPAGCFCERAISAGTSYKPIIQQ